MSLDDEFNPPGRPTHPDFMHLSEVVLDFDGRATEGGEDIHSLLRNVIDVESLSWMAQRRSEIVMEMAGLHLPLKQDHAAKVAIASIFVNAFAVGVTYERKYGSQIKSAPFDPDDIPPEA